jgi:hypothetical protein
MTTILPELPELDEPPEDGVYREFEGTLEPELAIEGNQMGEAIDPDDDDDNGL